MTKRSKLTIGILAAGALLGLGGCNATPETALRSDALIAQERIVVVATADGFVVGDTLGMRMLEPGGTAIAGVDLLDDLAD